MLFYFKKIVSVAAAFALIVFSPARADPAFDLNGNGMSDIWEIVYAAEALLPDDDTDDDGWSNLLESQMGTNPFGADLQLTPAIEVLPTGMVRVTPPDLGPDAKYDLFSNASLDEGSWVLRQSVFGASSFEAPLDSKEREFFRFSITPSELDGDGDLILDWEEDALGYDSGRTHTRRREVDDHSAIADALTRWSEVTIHTGTASFHEDWPDPGLAVVRRSGGIKPFTVVIEAGGSATPGVDYTFNGQSSLRTEQVETVVRGFLGWDDWSSANNSGSAAPDRPLAGLSANLTSDIRSRYGVASEDGTFGNATASSPAGTLGGSGDIRGTHGPRQTIISITNTSAGDIALETFHFDIWRSYGGAPGNYTLTASGGIDNPNATGTVAARGSAPASGNADFNDVDINLTTLGDHSLGPGESATLTLTIDGTTGGSITAIDNFGLTTSTRSPQTVSNAFTVDFPAGANEALVRLDALQDSLPEGTETITLNLHPFSTYSVGSQNQVQITLEDELNGLPDTEVSRFLQQTSFAATLPRIAEVQAAGSIENWIDAQMALPATSLQDIMENEVPVFFGRWREPAWWHMTIHKPDVLRQKTAYALSQILVISDAQRFFGNSGLATGIADYYDIFLTHAFGNYRDILYHVTRHPIMGLYLSHIQNRKPSSGNFPDENFAREVMQLFSIGLWELNTDGTRKLDGNNEPVPTYGNPEIREFARVFTGLSWGSGNSFGGGVFTGAPANVTTPMKMYDEHHDFDAKQLLDYPGAPNGGVLPAMTNTTANEEGLADIDAAIDNLFHHPNVGPFIAYRIIQRMVTSNPSPGYIGRVAAVFNDNGTGVRGDMAAVMKAILLDDEARNPAFMNDPNYGKLREPWNRFTHLTLAFRVQPNTLNIGGTNYEYYDIGGYSGEIDQTPQRAPNVFNWYLPDFQPPGEIRDLGLVAPEFQLLSDTWATKRVNSTYEHFEQKSDVATWSGNTLDYSPEIAMAGDIDALIDHLDLVLCYGKLKSSTREILHELLSRESSHNARVKLAVYLIGTSPEFSVLK